ncbi:DMT family transporter [Orbus sturtevantii]|uniref:EamA family transporter n=1 Tax=Orbus sturtevantii TaxID=3074109 RepID=UPI00370D9499
MKERFIGGLLVLLGACSFGVLSSIVKTAYKEGYSLGEITGVQSFFGMLILWGLYLIYIFFSKKKTTTSKYKSSSNNQKWRVYLAGFCPGLVGIFYYQCVQLIPASIAIILLMQYLWISVIIDYVIFRNKPTFFQVLVVVVILIGSSLAAGIFNQNISLNLKGCFFGILAAITYSLFITTSSKVGNDLPKLKKSALMITGACFITFVIFPPTFLFELSISDKLYQWGLILAVLGTVLPPLLFSIGMPKVGISFSAILSAAELPVAVIASYFYLKELIYYNQWIGVFLILLAMIAPNLQHLRRELRNK